MHLKCLELAGFKSFVDPTKIDFGDGITSIVGPNGCGKSNIVDAIRWVLGEHSAKHLRGGVMDDLVFQGSDTRAPVALCDVELTFSVNEGQLPSPYHELNEIRVRRRLMREGGSDGFINGKMVRIKDIVDLFLDTGISTRAYAIVEQGSIARMITAKPEERRMLFEEAAGVMKYRSRKREAERKMNHTRQNLERITDLLDEVRSQCRSLRQQSSRAERFKQLQDECQQVQALSFAIRHQQYDATVEKITAALSQAKTDEMTVAQRHSEAESVLLKARETLVLHETQAQQKQDALRTAEQGKAGLQQQAERLSGERKLLAERKTGLHQRMDETNNRIKQLIHDMDGLNTQVSGKDDRVLIEAKETAHQRLDLAKQTHADERVKRDNMLAEFERLRSEFENAGKRQEQAEQALTRLNQRQRSVADQLSDANNKLSISKKENDSAIKAFDAATQQSAIAEQELQQAQERLDVQRIEREKAAAKRAECEHRVRELRGQVQELKAQLAQHQDVPDSLRDHIRSQGSVWVDESLQVPEGLELAVAAALRGRAADAGLPASADLTKWREACDQAKEAPVALFAAHSGLSKCDNSLVDAMGIDADHPLFNMFAHVAFCEDIFAVSLHHGCTVSCDGWRLEADGWLIPPAQSQTARRLKLQRQLRECEKALLATEGQLNQTVEVAEQADKQLESLQKYWQQTHLTMTEAQSSIKAAQGTRDRLSDATQSFASRASHLGQESEAIQKDIVHWQEQRDGISKLDQEKLAATQQQLEKQTAKQQQFEQGLHQIRNELATAEQALALHQQAVETLKRDLNRLQQEQKELHARLEKDQNILSQTEQQIVDAAKNDALDQQLTLAVEQVEAAHQNLNTLRKTGHELQQQVHVCEKSEREARSIVQAAAEARQKIEVQQASEQARLQDLADEIQHKFQTSAMDLRQSLDTTEEAVNADEVLQKAQLLEERLNRFGPVNLLAIEEFQQASEREQFLAEQAGDLEASLTTLSDTISRIDRTTKQRFQDVFDQTNAMFQKTFPRLFGGGRAELRLDSDDVLTAGVEVIAQPPGKHLGDIGLMSGGEKALTAVALVFSIFRIKPAPFCILDEVDAPLDDANVGRFNEMIKELASDVQFLAITHNKITMQMADRLIGVSMPEPGVSKIVAVEVGIIH